MKRILQFFSLVVMLCLMGTGSMYAGKGGGSWYGKHTAISTDPAKGKVYVSESYTVTEDSDYQDESTIEAHEDPDGDTKSFYYHAKPVDGFDFIGWCTEANSKVVWDDENPYECIEPGERSREEAQDFTLYAKFGKIITLNIGDNANITIPGGETLYGTISIPAGGHYKFTPSEAIGIYWMDGYIQISDHNNIAFLMSGTHKFELSNNRVEDITIDMNIASYTMPTITTTEEISIASIAAGSQYEYVYRFVAPTDGFYRFASNNSRVGLTICRETPYYTASPDSLVATSGIVSCEQGDVYFVQVHNNSEIAATDVTISVSELHPLEMGDNTGITIQSGSWKYYTFTAPDGGHYKFTPTQEIVICSESGNHISDHNNIAHFGTVTHFLGLYNSGETSITMDLNIASYTVPVLTTEGTTIASIAAGSQYEYVYEFWAPADGDYIFTTNNAGVGVSVYGYSPYNYPLPDVLGTPAYCFKNEPCYVRVYNNSEIPATNVTLSVSGVSAVERTPVTLDALALGGLLSTYNINHEGDYSLVFSSSPISRLYGVPVGDGIRLYEKEGNYVVAPIEGGTVIMAPANCYNMFGTLTHLCSIDFSNFNTSNVTNMGLMFHQCESLENLDLSGFNTSSVTDMNTMFGGCNNLQGLDLSGFNTSSVTNMNSMFGDCYNLQGLDLSSFNTSSVTDMSWMFGECNNLQGLDLSSFNTSSVTNMYWMFYCCSSLQSLSIGNLDMSSVDVENYGAGDMFTGCDSLTTLTLKSVPYLADETFNTQFSGEDKTVNYELDDNSVVYTGTNYLPAATTLAYRRTMTTKWGTLVLPFDVPADQEEYDLYSIIRVEEEELTLERPVGILSAGTPVLIRMSEAGKDAETGKYNLHLEAANETLNTSGALTSENVEGLTLTGTYSKKVLTEEKGYIINNDAFWNIETLHSAYPDSEISIGAFRAYLANSTSGGAAQLRISAEEATALDVLDSLSTGAEPVEVYDLNGRRLDDLREGVNIIKRGEKTYKVIVK